ncbi:COG3342 Uncharacterized conserved protein [Burkholderiaceae bacterium]
MNTPLNFNTFSIVARCEKSGAFGVAVASAVPSVGSMCVYSRSNVGAVSTQSWVNPYLAIDALDFLAQGASAPEALAKALKRDPDAALRQIGLIDSTGRAAAHTGELCTTWCGHLLGSHFSVQGNMLTDEHVLASMAAAFQENTDFADALLSSLKMGQAAGGDKRGKQSAALRIHGKEKYPLLDLRVDDHVNPIDELGRILQIAKAQYLPFVESMPARFGQGKPLSAETRALLMRSPQNR